MNSTTSLIAKQCRLHQWAEQIRDCPNQSDRMPVSEWCSLHESQKPTTTIDSDRYAKPVRK